MSQYRNPILPGFHPDPSICRAGDTFYLVNSTFEYYPGIPVYRSADLVHWTCAGHILDRKSQFDLSGCGVSEGLYAPTIRYHGGRFWCVCTNVSGGGNFYVTTDDIEGGKWSDPVWIQERGIDPSFLFDGGKLYFVSNEDGRGHYGIYLSELDPESGRKLGRERLLSTGCGGRNTEGPHLYHIGEYYYLMAAEGGTEYGHSEVILRSRDIFGPYEACPHNPILSHTDDFSGRIACTGHADLVDDANGNWWLVCLGIRKLRIDGRQVLLHNLGRETFLAPVVWEEGWPVVGENGHLSLVMDGPLPNGSVDQKTAAGTQNLSELRSAREWMFLRSPVPEHYELSGEGNDAVLRLQGTDVTIDTDSGSPTLLLTRQQAFCGCMETQVQITGSGIGGSGTAARAGITVYYDNEHHYDIALTDRDGMRFLEVRRRIYDLSAVTASVAVPGGEPVSVRIRADETRYTLLYSTGRRETVRTGEAEIQDRGWRVLDAGTTAAMCTEITRRMTFTGTLFGWFAEGCSAQFDHVSVQWEIPD